MPDPMNPELAAEIRAQEPDLLACLLADAAEPEELLTRIEIRRRGTLVGSFRIRPLHEGDVDACRKKATTYKKSPQLGVKIAEDTDNARLRSLLIYEATLPADRAGLWDNKAAQTRVEAMDGPGLIDRLLFVGEKEAIIRKIDEVSGFSELELLAGN